MNGRRRFLVGTVLSIQNSGFVYPACQNCCSRLTLTSCRYECYKCGTSHKDATHRYKLCVKVSEENRLHVITIFGKCLEKIFGGSADSCHLQISSQLSRDLEQDKAQALLFQAAERCLIGRSFIFAVKISENFGRSRSLSHSNLHQNLVACQIILLNEDSMSCTILSYFNLLVASISSSNSVQAKTDVSTDSTNRDLSDLGFSESNSSLHQSWCPYDEYWQRSLGLVSSPLSSTLSEGGRTEPFPLRESLTSPNTTECMQKKLSSTDIATPSPSTVSITTPRAKDSFSKPSHSNTRSPPSSSHFHRFPSKSKTVLGQESCLQNVCKSGSRPSQSFSARAMQPPLQTGEINQGKEEIWEDFPFSESLSEFIAKIEDNEDVRSPYTAKRSKTIISTEEKLLNLRECRRSCYLMTKQIQNCTVTKEASPFSFDKCTGNESDLRSLVPSCKVLRRDDTSLVDHTFPSTGNEPDSRSLVPSCNVIRRDDTSLVDQTFPSTGDESNSRSLIPSCKVLRRVDTSLVDQTFPSTGNEPNSHSLIPSCKVIRRDDTSLVDQTFPSAGLFDALSRDSARVQDHQNPSCSKTLSNGTSLYDSWDLCSFIEDLDKTAMSLEKGISRGNVVLGDELKRSDVDMEKVKSTMAGDHYNASADLFEASDNGTSLSQHIGQNNGQGRLLFSITDSPCTDLLPYRPRDSRISVSSVSEIYETWNNLPTEDFAPYLQSTPLLRRLSGTSRLTVDARCLRMTSGSRSSIVSIRTKSSSTIRHLLLKNTTQRKSAMFQGLSENGSLWSPSLSPFLSSERSTATIAKNRRTMWSHRLWKKEAILENEEDYETLRQGPTVKGTHCGSILGEDSIKRGGDAPDNVENLSPVNSSLQEGEDRLLQSDWSPELFPGKSDRSQPHECLQRRLF